MDSLPDHILTRIFYFTFESPQFLLLNFSSVSESFRSAIFRPQLWRNLNLVVAANPEQLESLRSFLQSTANGNIGSWLTHLSVTDCLARKPFQNVSEWSRVNPNEIDSLLPQMLNLQSLTIDLNTENSVELEESSLTRLALLCPSVTQVVLRMTFSEKYNAARKYLTRIVAGWPKLDTLIAPYLYPDFDCDAVNSLKVVNTGHIGCWSMCSMHPLLVQNGKTLRSVASICCSQLPLVVELIPRLEELSLSIRSSQFLSVLTARQFECLQFLSFDDIKDGVNLSPIIDGFRSGKLCNLRAINVTGCHRHWPTVTDVITQHCPNLEAADFGSVSGREEVDMIISRCRNLVILKLYCNWLFWGNSVDEDIFDSIPAVNLPKVQLLTCYYYMAAIKGLVRRTPGLVVEHPYNTGKEKLSTWVNGEIVCWEHLNGHWADRLQKKWKWPTLTVSKFLPKHCFSGF